MTNSSLKIFQFKIKLLGITPMIWRRVQMLSNSTFGDLHHVIQSAMGWERSHLHEFIMDSPKESTIHIGDAEEIPYVSYKMLDQDKTYLNNYFSLNNKKADYTYDFGDDWEHEIVLEKILDVTEGVKYPTCIAGKRACPPEDCGGIWGYQNLLEIMSDPKNDEYEEMIEWYGKIDSEKFNLKDVSLNTRTSI